MNQQPAWMAVELSTEDPAISSVNFNNNPLLKGTEYVLPSQVNSRENHSKDIDHELPMLEELGIDLHLIKLKAVRVLLPYKFISVIVRWVNKLGYRKSCIVETSDTPLNNAHESDQPELAGPLIFAILLCFLLLLQGKVEFGAIYSLILTGIFGIKILLSLMCDRTVSWSHVITALGYGLLPNVCLALMRTLCFLFWGTGGLLLVFAWIVVLWSAWCASDLIVTAMEMLNQRLLVFYPLILFYAVFATVTLF